MDYSLNISLFSYIALATAFIALLYLAIFYCRWLSRMSRKKNEELPECYPDVSVAVYCRENAPRLRLLIEKLLEQDYPAGVQIIIVNDGEDEEVKDVYNYFSYRNAPVMQTYVPAGAKSLSRRKLAMTLAVKGAHYENILFLDAESMPLSRNWLKTMTAEFVRGKDIVLGCVCYNPAQLSRQVNASLRFTWLSDNIKWINAALNGRCYRGDVRNIGMTRGVFMENKGFANSLNLHGGADDMFISEVATPDNTSVVLDRDGMVEMKLDREIGNNLKPWMLSHEFTSHGLGRRSKIMMNSGAFILLLLVAGCAVSIFFAPMNLPVICAAAVMFIVGYLLCGMAIVKSARILRVKTNAIISPMLLMCYPLSRLLWKLRVLRNRSRQFTWTGH